MFYVSTVPNYHWAPAIPFNFCKTLIVFIKWAIPGLFFIYFCLFNTVDNKQMFNKILPMTGVKPRISGIGIDRSTNWATTTSQKTLIVS